MCMIMDRLDIKMPIIPIKLTLIIGRNIKFRENFNTIIKGILICMKSTKGTMLTTGCVTWIKDTQLNLMFRTLINV